MKQYQAGDLLKEIAQAKGSEVDIRPLLACVIRVFGGYEGLAQKYLADYEALPAKSPSRERVLTNILRLIGHASVAESPDDEGKDDEEIEDEIKSVVRRAIAEEGQEQDGG